MEGKRTLKSGISKNSNVKFGSVQDLIRRVREKISEGKCVGFGCENESNKKGGDLFCERCRMEIGGDAVKEIESPGEYKVHNEH